MATRVDRWVARDGKEFSRQVACEAHDKWLCLLEAIPLESRDKLGTVYSIIRALLETDTLVLGKSAAMYYESVKAAHAPKT